MQDVERNSPPVSMTKHTEPQPDFSDRQLRANVVLGMHLPQLSFLREGCDTVISNMLFQWRGSQPQCLLEFIIAPNLRGTESFTANDGEHLEFNFRLESHTNVPVARKFEVSHRV